jgi:hypothetical protein
MKTWHLPRVYTWEIFRQALSALPDFNGPLRIVTVLLELRHELCLISTGTPGRHYPYLGLAIPGMLR